MNDGFARARIIAGGRAIVIMAALALGPAILSAGTVHGTVKNGTTGKTAPGVEVILIQLQGGMQPVANTQSDAQGKFSFDNASLGAQPMLVRAVYKGINFHQPVPPGASEVEVSIFDPTKDPKTIAVATRVVFFQPNGANLIVGEEYSVENKTQPPQAYFRGDGNFEFGLPENAQMQQVAASGPAGMPVVQATIDKTKGRLAIAYAFRPGESTVRYSYELPYAGNAATVKIPASPYLARRLLVVAPPSVQISGEGLQSGGQEQGMNIYGRENLAANDVVAVSVSGTAPPPDAANSGGNSQGQQQEGPGAGGANIQQVPGRLDALKWPLVGGFIGIFALGAIMLARKPVSVTSTAASAAPGAKSARLESKRDEEARKTQEKIIAAPAPAAFAKDAVNMGEVDAAVTTSLDALKERLFRLELRHQAGTITPEQYAEERARTEKILRDLVQG